MPVWPTIEVVGHPQPIVHNRMGNCHLLFPTYAKPFRTRTGTGKEPPSHAFLGLARAPIAHTRAWITCFYSHGRLGS